MSKIRCDFKLKDLFAIKHALESSIILKGNQKEYLASLNNKWPEQINQEQLNVFIDMFNKDVEHEKKVIDYVVEVISRYKLTEQHYDEV